MPGNSVPNWRRTRRGRGGTVVNSAQGLASARALKLYVLLPGSTLDFWPKPLKSFEKTHKKTIQNGLKSGTLPQYVGTVRNRPLACASAMGTNSEARATAAEWLPPAPIQPPSPPFRFSATDYLIEV